MAKPGIYDLDRSIKAVDLEELQTFDYQVSGTDNDIGIMTLAPYDYRAINAVGRKIFDPSINDFVCVLDDCAEVGGESDGILKMGSALLNSGAIDPQWRETFDPIINDFVYALDSVFLNRENQKYAENSFAPGCLPPV